MPTDDVVPLGLREKLLQSSVMTSSNGNIFRVTGHLCGEFTGPGEFPAPRPVARSFDDFVDLRLNNGWVNNREAGDLRCYRADYDVTVNANGWEYIHVWIIHCLGIGFTIPAISV